MFDKKKLRNPRIGMAVSEQGITVASDIYPCNSFAAEDWSGLSRWVQQHKLASKHTHLVLDNKQYQLNQVEPPAVPEAEVNSALLYSLRDRLDYKINETQIDHFSFPTDAQRGAQKKINVVTAHTPTLKKIIASIERAGLQPAIIDIAELALLNLLLERENIDKGICFLSYHEDVVTFMIYRNAELYLTRSVGINSWQECLDSKNSSAKERLLLEIQRTLDYYQSQLGQPPVAELIIPDWSNPLSPLIDYLANNLAMQVNNISFRGEDQNDATNTELRQCMLATAALTRPAMPLRKAHATG